MGVTVSGSANPSVPPALTPDPRLIGTAPVAAERQPTNPNAAKQPSPGLSRDDMALDRLIGGICRGC